MRGAKHERGGHNRAWRNGAENFLHPRDGTPSVQAFQLCAGIVVAQDFAEGIALMSHYGGAYLAKANAVSPAFAVEPEGGRNAVGHTDVFHCEGAAFEVGGTQGAAYLQFLPDDEAALRAYYAEARNMSAGAGLEWFEAHGKLLEAQRLRERTNYDIEMMRQLGYCNGIENYSRPLTGRAPGTPPQCLLDYFPPDFLTIIDESHAAVPQIRAMYNGDQARKSKLVDYGFRLPSAKDNRPLTFDEFDRRVGQVVFASATPGEYEYSVSTTVAEQVIRPTGLLDPPVEIRPLDGQIDDLIAEVRATAERGDRTLVTTLTKKSAENLAAYLRETGMRVEYLHSGIDAIERVAILGRLRKGEFDCLVGINLLREGLDFPEVALVAILDADKEGFLRSTTSLVQTAGRTARHVNGRVILYADHETDAIKELLAITERHRARQIAWNKAHGIVPKSAKRAVNESVYVYAQTRKDAPGFRMAAEKDAAYDTAETISQLQREMLEAADALEFERAAYLRDQIRELQLDAAEEEKPASKKSGRRKTRNARH